MNKNGQSSLYLGVLLVLGGILFFLDINGLLPGGNLSVYINLILGAVMLGIYLKEKKLSELMGATFFITNGLCILLHNTFVYNGLVHLLIIPGIMFLVAYMKCKNIGYLCVGAFLSSWAAYFLSGSLGLMTGLFMALGMGMLANALAFLIIYSVTRRDWAKIATIVLFLCGLFVWSIDMGSAVRYMLLNIMTIGSIIVGLVMIVRALFKNKEH